MKRISLLAALAGWVILAPPAWADEPPHRDFVRGLRERRYPDLALRYLEHLSQNPPRDLAAILPLEMAKTRLDIATHENDAGKRSALYNQARVDFETFIKNNPNDPLAAEANLDIARISALLGKAQMTRAMQQEGAMARNTEAAKARALFEEAGKKLKDAEKQIDAQLAKDLLPKTKRDLTQAKLQAQFEQAMNLVDQGQTFVLEKDGITRGLIIQKAIEALKKLAAEDPKNPLCWQARAWAGQCYLEVDSPTDARREFSAVMTEDNEAADAGRRLVRYFRLLMVPKDPQEKKPDDTVQKLAEDWLRLYPLYTNTAEGCGVRWQLANLFLRQAQALPKVGPKKDQFQAKAIDLFGRAQRLFKALEEVENDYTEKARQLKLRIILTVSADRFKGDISKLANFEEAYLWAQYEAAQITEDDKKIAEFEGKLPPEPLAAQKQELKDMRDKAAAQRKTHMKNIIGALLRALEIAEAVKGVGVDSKDVSDARYMLTYAYLSTSDLYRAAIFGEHMARSDPNSSRSTSAAAYALQAYVQLTSEAERAGAGEKELNACRTRLMELADYMEKTWPADPATDAARHQIASIHLRKQNYAEAIKVLERITAGYPSIILAQYQLAVAAFEIQKDKAKPLTDAQKKVFQDKAVKALQTIPDVAENADPDSAHVYVLAKLQLGQILYEAKKYEEMDPLAAALNARFPNLKIHAEVKEKLAPAVAALSYYAKYGQVNATYVTGDYAKVVALTDPIVEQVKAELGKGGPPGIKDPQLLRALLGLGLRANVQTGNTSRAKEILELLQKAAATSGLEGGITGILVELVQGLRKQMEELRQKGPKFKGELEKTERSFLAFLDTLAKQPDLVVEALKKDEKIDDRVPIVVFLATSYSSLNRHDKAADLLGRIPEKAKSYRAIQVMQLRETRQDARDLQGEPRTKALDNVKKQLNTLLETEWGKQSIDLERERLNLLEDLEIFGGEKGATQGWNALMQRLRKRDPQLQDTKIRDQYYEAYYHLVFCFYKNALRIPDEKKRADSIARSAKFIVSLESNQPDMGGEVYKKQYEELLKKEPPLKAEYEKQGGKGLTAGAEPKKTS